MNGHIDKLCTNHLNLLRCDIKSQKHRKELIHRPEIAVTHKANRFLKRIKNKNNVTGLLHMHS